MLQIADRAGLAGTARIMIVDACAARRERLCARIEQARVCAEPLALLSDFDTDGGDPALVLVHDEGGALAAAVAWSTGLASPPPPILAYGQAPPVARVVQAMKAGACDYLECPIDDGVIERIIEQAVELSARSARTVDRQFYATWAIERLTSRERQVLVALSKGLTSQQIAEDLSISARTVETHRYNLRRKLGSIRTAEALRLVFEHGLGDSKA